MKVYVLLSFLLLGLSSVHSLPCVLKRFSGGTVCVCNSSYCDTLEDIEPPGNSEYVQISSGKDGSRFTVTQGQFINSVQYTFDIEPDTPSVIYREKRNIFDDIIGVFQRKDATVTVNRDKTYQNIVGFGGAFTGSVSYNLDKLSPLLQNHVYTSYYSKTKGIGYNLMRIPVGGSDFDLVAWAYNENPINDATLSNFTKLDSRDIRKIQQIKQLQDIAGIEDIKFYGTAWSPPKWMKTNNKWTGFSFLKQEYYQTWADYHLKWLDLMDASGIPFWAISTGNEPLNGVITFMFVPFVSLGWKPENQAKWIAKNFGPTLRNSKFKDILIFGPEDQRITIPEWLDIMKKTDQRSIDYLDGISVHWYLDEFIPVSFMDRTHANFKDKIMINSESCAGSMPFNEHGPVLGDWGRAERYINDYISDFQNWLNGWIDWNLVLDEQGGPNYVRNFVDAPIIISADGSEIYKQPIFYAIGHFSRFMIPNSIRIDSSSSESTVKTIAVKRPDESIAVIVYNSKRSTVNLEIQDSIRGKIHVKIPPSSIHSFVYN